MTSMQSWRLAIEIGSFPSRDLFCLWGFDELENQNKHTSRR